MLDGQGERVGAVAIFSDLTEIKQLQRQVLQTEKMASIGQLAAGVAHEINNPMGFIHANLFQMAEYLADLRRVWTYVDSVQKAVTGGDLDDIRAAAADLDSAAREVDVAFLLSDLAKAIRESQEGSERIRHIVHDLRDFSHSDSEQSVLAYINQCLDSTANIVWPMMRHLVVLEKEYRDLPQVYCYPMQLKQVFMNLLVNAYQAIEEKVGESGESGRIWLTVPVDIYTRSGSVLNHNIDICNIVLIVSLRRSPAGRHSIGIRNARKSAYNRRHRSHQAIGNSGIVTDRNQSEIEDT